MDILKVLRGKHIDKKKNQHCAACIVLLRTKFELKFRDVTLIELPVTDTFWRFIRSVTINGRDSLWPGLLRSCLSPSSQLSSFHRVSGNILTLECPQNLCAFISIRFPMSRVSCFHNHCCYSYCCVITINVLASSISLLIFGLPMRTQLSLVRIT